MNGLKRETIDLLNSRMA